MIKAVIAVITGVLSGMGIGGGSLLIIILSSFMDYSQKSAQGTNLIYFFPTAAVSLVIHFKNRLIEKKTALVVALSGSISAALFGFLAMKIDDRLLRKCFAILILITGVYEFIGALHQDKTEV